jgi:HEAT repeat protein
MSLNQTRNTCVIVLMMIAIGAAPGCNKRRERTVDKLDNLLSIVRSSDDASARDAALDGIEEILRHDNSAFARANACNRLRELGPQAASTVPAIAAATRDDNGAVRWEAVRALGAIGPAAASAIPELVEVVRTDPMGYGSDAAEALANIGAPAVVSLPDLEKGLARNVSGATVDLKRRSYEDSIDRLRAVARTVK